MRDIAKLVEEQGEEDEVAAWSEKVKAIYKKAKEYTGPDVSIYQDARSQQQKRWKDQAELRDELLSVCRPYVGTEKAMRKICERIDKYQDELFLFVADPQVKSENNTAERSLRHSVITRKISGGTRSTKGSQTRSVLASLFGTWRLQGKNCYQECLDMLSANSQNLSYHMIPKL